jgi:hypothetical protein
MPEARDRAWEDVLLAMRGRYPDEVELPAFRRGWERGQVYRRERDLRKTA